MVHLLFEIKYFTPLTCPYDNPGAYIISYAHGMGMSRGAEPQFFVTLFLQPLVNVFLLAVTSIGTKWKHRFGTLPTQMYHTFKKWQHADGNHQTCYPSSFEGSLAKIQRWWVGETLACKVMGSTILHLTSFSYKFKEFTSVNNFILHLVFDFYSNSAQGLNRSLNMDTVCVWVV